MSSLPTFPPFGGTCDSIASNASSFPTIPLSPPTRDAVALSTLPHSLSFWPLSECLKLSGPRPRWSRFLSVTFFFPNIPTLSRHHRVLQMKIQLSSSPPPFVPFPVVQRLYWPPPPTPRMWGRALQGFTLQVPAVGQACLQGRGGGRSEQAAPHPCFSQRVCPVIRVWVNSRNAEPSVISEGKSTLVFLSPCILAVCVLNKQSCLLKSLSLEKCWF